MQGGERFNSIGDYLKSEFGRKTVKLSIDAGFTCPNRDGTCGYGGCAFCSGGGSGELAVHKLQYPRNRPPAGHGIFLVVAMGQQCVGKRYGTDSED